MPVLDQYTVVRLNDSSDPLSFVSTALVMKQLSGRRRTVVLTGRALPYRGLQLGVEQRHVKTELPLSNVAPLQMLGVNYPNTTIEGRWVQEYIQTGTYASVDGVGLVTTRQLEQLFHDMVAEGQLLSVSWDTQNRIGILAKFTPTWDRAAICKWSAEFVWQSRGTSPDYRPVGVAPSPFGRQLSWLDKALAGVKGALAALDTAQGVWDSMRYTLNTIGQIITTAQDVIRSSAKLVTTPVELARRVLTLMTQIVAGTRQAIIDASNAIVASVQQLVAAAVSMSSSVLADWNFNAFSPYMPSSSPAVATGAGTLYDKILQADYVTPGEKTAMSGGGVYTPPPDGQIPAVGNSETPEVIAGETVETPPVEVIAGETVPPDDGHTGPGGTSGADGASSGIPGGAGASSGPGSGVIEPWTPGNAGFATVLKTQNVGRQIERQLRRIRDLANDMVIQAEKQLTTDYRLKAIWYARQNEDLRDVAQAVYGDHMVWVLLARFNKLESALLDPGQVVLAPLNIGTT